MSQRFEVGYKFTKRTKHRVDHYTIEDFLVTKNLAGETVKEEYKIFHDFLGQKIYDIVPVASCIYRAEIGHVD